MPEPIDCLGESGGSAEYDNCGTCDADPANDCLDCSSYFDYNQSMSQAFYYFQSVTINAISLDTSDWVGAFNGDICVGKRKWDVSQCGGDACDVPAMGYIGTNDTQQYCTEGDVLVFKIYDVSEGLIYNTMATGDITPWQNLGLFVIDSLVATTAAPCQ